MEKSADAYRTISEVADALKLPQHVLRFWETRFPQVKPMKRGGNRRFYRPEDIDLLRAIRILLYEDGYTIKGVQRILREQGPRAVTGLVAKGQRPEARRGRSAAMPQDADVEAALVFAVPRREEMEFMAQREPPHPPSPSAASPAERRDASAPRPGGSERPAVPGRGLTESLQAVLAELAECEQILAAARR